MKPSRVRLAVHAKDWSRLLTLSWDKWPRETGGVLVGTQNDAGELVVGYVIGPGPAAAHEQRTFTPDHAWQAKQVEKLWRADHCIQYLGDWHTHPRGRARLSSTDVDTLRLIAASPSALQLTPMMLVVALGSGGDVEAGVTRLERGRCRKLRLEVGAATITALSMRMGTQPNL